MHLSYDHLKIELLADYFCLILLLSCLSETLILNDMLFLYKVKYQRNMRVLVVYIIVDVYSIFVRYLIKYFVFCDSLKVKKYT